MGNVADLENGGMVFDLIEMIEEGGVLVYYARTHWLRLRFTLVAAQPKGCVIHSTHIKLSTWYDCRFVILARSPQKCRRPSLILNSPPQIHLAQHVSTFPHRSCGHSLLSRFLVKNFVDKGWITLLGPRWRTQIDPLRSLSYRIRNGPPSCSLLPLLQE